jgi:pilus assembly protein CpaC
VIRPFRSTAFRVAAISATMFVYSSAGASSPRKAAASVAKDAPDSAIARASFGVHSSGASDVLKISIGHSMVLTTASPLRRVYIGNPTVLQSYSSSSTELVLTAKSPGISSMVLWDRMGHHCLYTVSADLDGDGLLSALQSALPRVDIHVAMREGKVYLSGVVPNDATVDTAVKIASTYAKDVVNSLQVMRGREVQLKLRIIEVDRTKLEQFGINFFTGGGNNTGGISTQQFNSSVSTTSGTGSSSVSVSNPLNLFLYNSSINVGLTVQALEQQNIMQILAEPTLTALSGHTATFLSGGEFPFPVVQGGSVAGASAPITISFRPYGVKVDFTPTVSPDGTIRLKVSPEVSALDYTNAVTISGFTIPALSTRRAETEVELMSGQTFVVSGLLDHRTTQVLSRIPGISNIPVLGQLFRSKSITRSVVELVVMVTPTIVDPIANPEQPAEPSFPLPNMDSKSFDSQTQSSRKQGVTKPADSGMAPQ